MRWEGYHWWYLLAAIFAVFTLISALGEWVFHWWESPGDLASFSGLVATVVALGVGASRRDLQRLGHHLGNHLGSLAAGQDRLAVGQERIAQGQERIAQGQERIAQGQERIAQGQERLQRGQDQQTSLLEEIAAWFRRNPRSPERDEGL